MELHLKIIGLLLVCLSSVHFIFPKYFNWSEEFRHLSLINRQMIHVHTFFIALAVFLMGVLCLTSSAELTGTKLGNKIALGLGVFWAVRLFVQFFVYSPRLWKGRRLETSIHIFFSLLWIYFAAVFLIVYVTNHY